MSTLPLEGREATWRPSYIPLRARSILAMTGLTLHAFISVLMILASAWRISQLQSLQRHTPVGKASLQAAGVLYLAGSRLHLVTWIFSAVTFLLWFYRAHKNLLALRTEPLEFSAGEAVGYFFVPFLNLVKPYSAMREIWEASDPAIPPDGSLSYAAAPSSPLLPAWWGMFLARNVLGWISFFPRLKVHTLATLITTLQIVIVMNIASIVAAGLACALLLRIWRRQEKLAEQIRILDRVGVF